MFLMSALAREWKGDLQPSLLWLATATVTAIALAVGPPRSWFAIAGGFVGGIAAGPLLYDDTFPGLLGPVFGNTTESVILAVAIPVIIGRDVTVRNAAQGFAVLGVVAAGTAIGGLIAVTGTTSTVIGDTFESWWRWVLGNSVGQVLLLPLVLFRRTGVITRHSEQRPVELVITVSLMLVVGFAAFAVDSFLIYLVIPLILWIAIRFGPFVAAPVAIVAAVSVATATGQGYGPFVTFDDDPQLQVQLFQLSLAACVFIGGAHAVRAWNDRNHLVAVLSALPDILFVRKRHDGRIVSSWIPSGSEKLAVGLDPESSGVTPAIEATPSTPSDPTIVVTDNDEMFERRTVAIDEERDLDLFRDVTIEQEALRQLQSRRDAVDDARREEQLRLGRALHDSPIQLLSAALLRLGTAMKDPGSNPDHVAKAEQLTRQAVTELREGIDQLTSTESGDRDVVELLGSLARQLLADDVEIELRPSDTPIGLDDLERTLLLLGREAVSNAALHAEASRLTVGLEVGEASVVLTVADDGRGVTDSTPLRRGLGLSLMRERVAQQGGEISVEPGSNGGTAVRITLPITRDG